MICVAEPDGPQIGSSATGAGAGFELSWPPPQPLRPSAPNSDAPADAPAIITKERRAGEYGADGARSTVLSLRRFKLLSFSALAGCLRSILAFAVSTSPLS